MRRLYEFFRCQNVHSTLHPLFHHRAGRFVRLVNVAVEMIVVCATTARTNKFRKAVFAFFTREKAGIFEFFANIGAGNALVYATHFKRAVPRKLMAGIQIAVGDNGKIFVARATRRYAFRKTRPALQIDIEMEKVKAHALFMTL